MSNRATFEDAMAAIRRLLPRRRVHNTRFTAYVSHDGRPPSYQYTNYGCQITGDGFSCEFEAKSPGKLLERFLDEILPQFAAGGCCGRRTKATGTAVAVVDPVTGDLETVNPRTGRRVQRRIAARTQTAIAASQRRALPAPAVKLLPAPALKMLPPPREADDLFGGID